MTAARQSSFFVVVLLCAVLLLRFQYGDAIICYKCNSEYDPRCGDPFDPYSLGTVNCSYQPRPEHLGTLEPTICRKISQKVYGKERVVRDCGYLTEPHGNTRCILRSGTHDVRATYCDCVGDLCNSAMSSRIAIGLTVASVLVSLFSGPTLLTRAFVVFDRLRG